MVRGAINKDLVWRKKALMLIKPASKNLYLQSVLDFERRCSTKPPLFRTSADHKDYRRHVFSDSFRTDIGMLNYEPCMNYVYQ